MMDFGSAYTPLSDYLERLGTPGYIAPELLLDSRVSKAADLFSLGMLFCKLISGVNPMEEFQRNALETALAIQDLFRGRTAAIPIGMPVNLPSLAAQMKQATVEPELERVETPPNLLSIIKQLTDFDPSKRPSANEVRLHLSGLRQGHHRVRAPSIFISHASADKERFVRSFAEFLRGKGFNVWLDEWGLRVGEPFWDRIADAIGTCDFVLVVLSNAAVTSPNVAEELRTAQLDNINKVKILPIRIDPLDFTSIPKHLRTRHVLDFVGWEGNETVFYRKVEKLASDIWALVESK